MNRTPTSRTPVGLGGRHEDGLPVLRTLGDSAYVLPAGARVPRAFARPLRRNTESRKGLGVAVWEQDLEDPDFFSTTPLPKRRRSEERSEKNTQKLDMAHTQLTTQGSSVGARDVEDHLAEFGCADPWRTSEGEAPIPDPTVNPGVLRVNFLEATPTPQRCCSEERSEEKHAKLYLAHRQQLNAAVECADPRPTSEGEGPLPGPG